MEKQFEKRGNLATGKGRNSTQYKIREKKEKKYMILTNGQEMEK